MSQSSQQSNSTIKEIQEYFGIMDTGTTLPYATITLEKAAEFIERSYLLREQVEAAVPEKIKPTEGYANEPRLIAYKDGYNKCRRDIFRALGLHTKKEGE